MNGCLRFVGDVDLTIDTNQLLRYDISLIIIFRNR